MFVITDYTKTRIILFLSPWKFYFMDNLQIIYKVWGLSLELGTLCLYNKKVQLIQNNHLHCINYLITYELLKLQQFINIRFLR